MTLSKSKYCTYVSCPKRLWLHENLPEKEIITKYAQHLMDQGTETGKVARGYFGSDYALAEVIVGGKPDKIAMIDRTKQLMAAGNQTICEAAFDFNGNYCAVDLLHKEGEGWAIYEVKSASEFDDIYNDDVAYQYWVLKNCGVNVTGVKLLQINTDYIKRGNLDLKQLFKETDLLSVAQAKFGQVGNNIIALENYLAQKTEPPTVFNCNCAECGFCDYCRSIIPEQSVFNLRGIIKKYDYINSGIVTFSDFARCGKELSDGLKIQLKYDTPAKGTYIDREGIRGFLKKLSFPLYFLDFETFQFAVPQFDDSKPWQQIPSQYSLHWIESDADAKKFLAGYGNNYEKNSNGNLSGGIVGNGNFLKHTEFLGDGVNDPRRELAERLCKDIPLNVCVLAYNKTFECTRLGELADLYPDLREHLLNIRDHIVDLAEPFKNYFYYNSAMQGRYSIKYVLPAIYPGDPSLSYSGLVVKNGTEAMLLYPQLKDMTPVLQEKARKDLLEYCKLDTFAMVKLWQELVRVS